MGNLITCLFLTQAQVGRPPDKLNTPAVLGLVSWSEKTTLVSTLKTTIFLCCCCLTLTETPPPPPPPPPPRTPHNRKASSNDPLKETIGGGGAPGNLDTFSLGEGYRFCFAPYLFFQCAKERERERQWSFKIDVFYNRTCCCVFYLPFVVVDFILSPLFDLHTVGGIHQGQRDSPLNVPQQSHQTYCIDGRYPNFCPSVCVSSGGGSQEII